MIPLNRYEDSDAEEPAGDDSEEEEEEELEEEEDEEEPEGMIFYARFSSSSLHSAPYFQIHQKSIIKANNIK